MTHKEGKLLVISGPSGVGKDTVMDIITSISSFKRFSTCTTRRPRQGEIDGVHYNFLNEQEFEKASSLFMMASDVRINGYRYGLSIDDLEKAMSDGQDCIVQLVVPSAEVLKIRIPRAILIYLMPPNLLVLTDRLRKRGGIPEGQVLHTLKDAQLMAPPTGFYSFLLVNEEDKPQETAVQILEYLGRSQ